MAKPFFLCEVINTEEKRLDQTWNMDFLELFSPHLPFRTSVAAGPFRPISRKMITNDNSHVIG